MISNKGEYKKQILAQYEPDTALTEFGVQYIATKVSAQLSQEDITMLTPACNKSNHEPEI